MIEVFGNAWEIMSDYDYLCITTNGNIARGTHAVMGAGIAKEATRLCNGIDITLAKALKARGNVISNIGMKGNTKILSFPVKHNWYDNADIDLIVKSCNQLMNDVIGERDVKVLLPRPGCGNGNLDWHTEVKSVIGEILDDRVYIVHFRED